MGKTGWKDEDNNEKNGKKNKKRKGKKDKDPIVIGLFRPYLNYRSFSAMIRK